MRYVASYTGAWIETQKYAHMRTLNVVASYTGAWIETGGKADHMQVAGVASYTGAWIETFLKKFTAVNEASHPIRVRGLKHIF